MSVCNLFTKFEKETGNFLMFSQYTKDLTQSNARGETYRVVPSKFYAMDIDYNDIDYNAVGVPSYGSSEDLNLDIPIYFQNVFENSCAYCEENLEVFTPNNAKSLFWTAMYKAGMIGNDNPSYIRYVGDINIQSFDEYNGMGYSEIYCYIPSDETHQTYNVSYSAGVNHIENENTYIEGYSDIDNVDNVNGNLSQYTDYKNYYYESEFNISGSVTSNPPTSYNINTIIVFYDIFTDNSTNPTYTNIPLGIYFTGKFDNEHRISNTITKYITNEDAYGMGTSYGLRICSRFTVSPRNISINSIDVTNDGTDNFSAFCQVMTKMSENIDKMNECIDEVSKQSENNGDILSILKNSRTNVPYIKTIAGKKYWFVNGKKLDDAPINPSLYEDVSYSKLKTLKDTGQLVPGQQYRITDYVTTTSQENTQSAEHQFDIIITADDESTLNENVRAILHEGDTYFTDADLSAWELKYCIDNDIDRFEWVDNVNGKGVIYYMKDEYGNECPYDFKNIQFKHPNDEDDNNYYYTFTNKISDVISDKSLTEYCYNNVIKEYIDSNKITLNRNIFINTRITSSCYNNSFGNGCYNNSFGDGCTSNKFGNSCLSNEFEYNCSYNSFGNGCNSNEFKYSCGYNEFGNNCFSNKFGWGCQSNSFGNSCNSNEFGTSCSSNSFGNGCYSNEFGGRCISNSFGNSDQSNSLGWSCQSNSFGNSCNSNEFGDSCYNNSFGNSCSYNSFRTSETTETGVDLRDYCRYNHFDDGCSYNVIWNTETGSNSIQLRNININRGVSGTSSKYNFINLYNTETNYLHAEYEIQVSKNSNKEIKIFCLADLIT